MKKDESSDLEATALQSTKVKDSSAMRGTKGEQKFENTADKSNLYQKVYQRKEIL